MTTYICTCGTSIITKRNIDFEKIKGIPLTQWEKYGTDIELIKEQVLSELQNISLPQDLNDTSAEIKSLIKMGLNSTLTPKNQNLPIFGHFSPVISDVPTTFFPISSTRGGTAIPAALNPK